MGTRPPLAIAEDRSRACRLTETARQYAPPTPELPLLVPWLPPGACRSRHRNLTAARRRSLIGINVRCCGIALLKRRVSPHREFHRAYTFPYGAANDSDPSHHRVGPLRLDDGRCCFGRYANLRLLHHPLRTRPPERPRGSSAPPEGGCRHRCPSENGASVEELIAPRHIPARPLHGRTNQREAAHR